MTEASDAPLRLVIFGVTGQVGQELVEQLDDSEWPIGELLGVASADSAGTTFGFRGQEVDVVAEWPALKGRDLVFLCAGGEAALEVVRECLRAEVACVDLTGALSSQSEVPVVFDADPASERLRAAPLLAMPGSTALSWARVLRAVAPEGAEKVERVVGTVMSSAASHGRKGLVALSDESIALFNQSEAPEPGPAGQGVAFDVIPGGGVDAVRVRNELRHAVGPDCRVTLMALQVPTFVGEGATLALELDRPIEREALVARLEAGGGLSYTVDGPGSRGLTAVDEDSPALAGPTLRDAAETGDVLVGRVEADPSLEEGRGWLLWIVSDPLRLVAEQALRVAGARLGRA